MQLPVSGGSRNFNPFQVVSLVGRDAAPGAPRSGVGHGPGLPCRPAPVGTGPAAAGRSRRVPGRGGGEALLGDADQQQQGIATAGSCADTPAQGGRVCASERVCVIVMCVYVCARVCACLRVRACTRH